MEENIKHFFEGPGKEAAEHLGSGSRVLFTTEGTSYVLEVTEERQIKIDKNENAVGDLDIRAEEKVTRDLFCSSNMHEYYEKLSSYIMEGKEPEVKIMMERTKKNSKIFLQNYYFFLRKISLLQ